MAFTYKLELEDGTPAGDYTAAVPNWKAGDTIPLGPGRALRVIAIRPPNNAEDNVVLVVERTQT